IASLRNDRLTLAIATQLAGAPAGPSGESNEGGASSGSLPQRVLGVLPRSNSNVVAGLSRRTSTGSHRLVLRTPLICIRCTYGRSSAALGALIRTVWPPGRFMVIERKSGLPMTKPPVPGNSGYRPSAEKTYHDDREPASSLPGIPLGRGVNSPI